MIFNKVPRQLNEEKIIFSTAVPTPCTKINSKWITDISVRSKSIKHLEENTVENHHDLQLGKEFLDMTPKAQVIRVKN